MTLCLGVLMVIGRNAIFVALHMALAQHVIGHGNELTLGIACAAALGKPLDSARPCNVGLGTQHPLNIGGEVFVVGHGHGLHKVGIGLDFVKTMFLTKLGVARSGHQTAELLLLHGLSLGGHALHGFDASAVESEDKMRC